MNAQRLASLLNYPLVWVEHGLLSAELVAAQSEQLVTECGAASAIGGTEHWRYGAFLHWFKRELGEQELGHLLAAAVADPDPPMAGNVLKLVVQHPRCTTAMLQAAQACASSTPEYYTSAQELEVSFASRAG